jgi:hypothetical protein
MIFRKLALAGAGLAAASALAIMAALPASASTTSAGSAGYTATGANFQTVKAAVYLRSPDQYATSQANGVGASVSLWSTAFPTVHGLVIQLGISDVPNSGAGYSPAAAVFDRSTHALIAATANGTIPAQWCPAGGTCQPATSGGSFPVGDSVTLRLHYGAPGGLGLVGMTESDAAGNVFTATYGANIARSFNKAVVSGDYGATPWDSAAVTGSPPASGQRYFAFSKIALTSYSGHRAGLVSWWKHTRQVMVAPLLTGTPAGLNAKGTSFYVLDTP